MTKSVSIQPIHEIRGTTRMPEAGRIRTGAKVPNTAKNAKSDTRPAALETFRFTSPHKDLVEAIAANYGGTVQPWNEPAATIQRQWQVITESNRVRVALPPSDQAFSQDYEAWSGGGCIRRCDGEVCHASQQTDDGAVPTTVPCLCAAQQVRICKIHSRLNVVLLSDPDCTVPIPFRGSWRLETQSEYAAREMAGMVDLVLLAQSSGFTKADLGLEKRRIKRPGEKLKEFVVPTLTLPYSPEQLLSGDARLVGIAAAPSMPAGELPSGTCAECDNKRTVYDEESGFITPCPKCSPPARAPLAPDEDGIIDGEVLEDYEPTELELRCHAQADKFIVDRTQLWDAVLAQANGDLVNAEKGVAMMERGEIEPIGFKDGRAQWARK